MPSTVKASSFVGWGKLQDWMFEEHGTAATAVVQELLEAAETRFADLAGEELDKAVTAYVGFYAWQGLADARADKPAQYQQGGIRKAWSESQLVRAQEKADGYRGALEPFMPELGTDEPVFGGPLVGGADIPAAFRFARPGDEGGPYPSRNGHDS